jgi:uncharacterized YceG family protein
VRRLAVALLVAGLLLVPTATADDGLLHVVFPEGQSVRQMVDRVSAVRLIAIHKRHITPVLTAAAYAKAASRASVPPPFRADDKRHSIEGFLFPATYAFDQQTTAGQLIHQQLLAFDQRWSAVTLSPRAKTLSPYAVVTIASMVEREAVVPSERPLIAAVIYNRLDKSMPLGIDATIRYGLGIQGTRPLTAAELANPSPYNTDLHAGLPPTPIGNPGLPSLKAAAAPADVDYLYYLRKPNSQHHFFTDSESVFCAKAAAWGYRGC